MTSDTRQLDLFASPETEDAVPDATPPHPAEQAQHPVGQPPSAGFPQWLCRDRNLVVRASAGTGKTEALTELYVHWIAGVGGQRLKPSQILATTFTEKAAEEMRERISAALIDIVDASGNAVDCQTRIGALVCERLGQGVDLGHFRLCRQEINDAPIGTFHSVCGGWLRLYADALPIAADFDVLTEFEAERLRHDALVVSIRASIEQDEAVRSLLEDFRNVEGDFSAVSVLEPIMLEILEQGEAPPSMWASHEAAERTELIHAAPISTEQVPALWSRLISEHRKLLLDPPSNASSRAVYTRVADLAGRWEAHPRAQRPDRALLVEVAFALEEACGSLKVAKEVGPKSIRDEILVAWTSHLRQLRSRAVRRLVESALLIYQQRKEERGALDFSDLLVLTRRLLKEKLGIRQSLATQFEAVLVDEFQDTNAVQRDLVLALREHKKGGLVVVGDRKQSIYGFRGADIAVYEGLAQQLMANGAREHVLDQSYRTVPRALQVINTISEAALGSSQAADKRSFPFELRFDPEKEALRSARAQLGDRARVAVIDPLEDGRKGDREPMSVARYIASLVREERVIVEVSGEQRPANYGDVALLLPRFTKLGDFTRALDLYGVPYRVRKGRGLLGTPEARDLMSLAALLLGVDDGKALLAVLRGPMVMLSDDELRQLVSQDRNFFRSEPEAHDWDSLVGEVPAAWIRMLLHARRSIDRSGLMAAVDLLLASSSYRQILTTLPSGEQRVANVDRICSELWTRERAGESPRELYRELRVRAERERDPEADVVGVAAQAVSIMTVHQSKGLQFPVVVAAELGRSIRSRSDKLLYDRDAPGGLAVSVRGLSQWFDGAEYKKVQEVAKARSEAEAARLLYVQLTRTRDFLVLSGEKRGMRSKVIEPALQDLDSDLVEWVGVPEEPAIAEDPSGSDLRPPRALKLLETTKTWEVSVTMLEEFARCPRRFSARTILGDLVDPSIEADSSDAGMVRDQERSKAASSERPSMDPRQRGVLLHRLLEDTDWALALADPDVVEAQWTDQLAVSGAPQKACKDLLVRLKPFLKSHYARRLSARGVNVQRELPFTFSLPAGGDVVLVRGQIDLLVEFDNDVHIIDYKTTTPAHRDPVRPYAFQLAAYAMGYRAASGARGATKSVSAGIWFADGTVRDPFFDDASVGDAVRDVSKIAKEFAATLTSGIYGKRKIATCRALACPLVATCHGDSRS